MPGPPPHGGRDPDAEEQGDDRDDEGDVPLLLQVAGAGGEQRVEHVGVRAHRGRRSGGERRGAAPPAGRGSR